MTFSNTLLKRKKKKIVHFDTLDSLAESSGFNSGHATLYQLPVLSIIAWSEKMYLESLMGRKILKKSLGLVMLTAPYLLWLAFMGQWVYL